MQAKFEQDLPTLPEGPAADRIVGCRLYTWYGDEETTQDLPRDATVAEVLVPVDTDCENGLVYLDAVGNESEGSYIEFHSPAPEEPLPTPTTLSPPRFIEFVDEE